jgi:hypothetical protein
MVERRNEPRVRTELCVRLSGINAQGEPFMETVTATNISRSGALLTKVRAVLRCGDLVAIDCGGLHSYFRIVWVLNSGQPDGTQAAIHKLTSQPCPWGQMLPAETVLATDPGGAHG